LTLDSTHDYTADDDRYAREKFGSQKAISSDEFFGRNQFDPQAQAEARTRLKGFEGASAISSNQYFGIPENDDLPEDDSLEGQARQLARKYAGTVGEDLDSVTQALGQGAAKLQDALKQYVPQGRRVWFAGYKLEANVWQISTVGGQPDGLEQTGCVCGFGHALFSSLFLLFFPGCFFFFSCLPGCM